MSSLHRGLRCGWVDGQRATVPGSLDVIFEADLKALHGAAVELASRVESDASSATRWGGRVTVIEIAVGYVFSWLIRKAQRVGGRADSEVDRTLDVGMDKVHELVSRKLGMEPALQRAQEEAEAGQDGLSPRTRQRLELALEDAVERDLDFGVALQEALDDLLGTAEATGSRVHNEISGGIFHGPVLQAGHIARPSFTSSEQQVGGSANHASA
ncbi:hypothetical protein [Streptacidiphilus sp. EB129]|uniref:hypothetical protein n=1 Tax=Streptacidiphilus sp. EB129 TaxID=3156262 RepID=UPI003512FCF8